MKAWAWTWMMALGLILPGQLCGATGDELPAAPEPTEAAKTEAAKPVDADSAIPRLAELRLDEYLVPARMINLSLPGKTKTVQEVLDRLEEWSKDEKIGGVLLDVGYVVLSMPDVEELRAGIQRLRKSGKKVSAFLNNGNPHGYLLACAADEITLAPTGSLMIPGLGRLFPYMKGYYQMQGIEFDVITAGKYKYPGFLNRREPDQYFQEEFGAILDSWIVDYARIIGESRNLTPVQVREVIDIAMFSGTEAQQRGLVDELAYYDDYRERILKRDKMKRQAEDDGGLANVNSIQDLVRAINEEMERSAKARQAVGPKIAVLHARGPIIDFNLGPGFASQLICRDDFVKVVEELRKNTSIKAVVMHVDSPGGSGYASDVIWTHLRRLNETKPLVVCMGAVAGSGGYYIACPARRIFAQPTTLTGSIGVLGILQSAQSMYNRMDMELAEMKRGARSMLGSSHEELSKEDRAFIQKYMDDFYDIFIERVASSRKMPEEEVRKVAEGRIWTGRDALKIGLVDELGGLAEGIESARAMANIPPSAELKIVHYPRPSSLGEIFETFSPGGAQQVIETFMRGVHAAPTVSFEQQVGLFSQRLQPLCWMATPSFMLTERLDVPGMLRPVDEHMPAGLRGLPAMAR